MEGLKIVVTILFLVVGFWYARNYVNKNKAKQLNADEAKKLADKSRVIQAKKQIERINKQIEEAALLGHHFVNIYVDYEDEVEFYLKSLGYRVYYGDKFEEKKITVIKWQ